jgi:hypothetical protein
VQQRTLVRVVVVGGVNEDAVRQRRERGLRLHAGDADHRCAIIAAVKSGNFQRNARLRRVFGPRADGAADGVDKDAAGLIDDRLR